MLRAVSAVFAVAVLGAAPATAQDFRIDEVRGGIMAHSTDETGPGGTFWNLTRIQDANVELLFSPIDAWTGWGEIRPHVGATVNFGGLESMAYAGLSWKVNLFDSPVFFEGAFGAAVHNGAASGAAAPARDLGCALLFREAANLGVDVTENASVMLTLEHASHAGLCGPLNRGLTNLGVRVGVRF